MNKKVVYAANKGSKRERGISKEVQVWFLLVNLCRFFDRLFLNIKR